MAKPRKIEILDALVAQRIAAGEVIERPSSVIRELIDNSIDAEAKTITVILVDGGNELITVIDDGTGISKEDLPLVFKSHATSKVRKLEDLQNLYTMGFRGEALYSIASSAKVTISSDNTTFTIDNGIEEELLPSGVSSGTKVDVENLFGQIPARRLFLKRASTEFNMCRNVLIEKAIAFPEIAFRLYDKEKLRLDFSVTDKKGRLLDVLANDKNVVASELIEFNLAKEDFSLYAIGSVGGSYRSDRSHIKIYINKRAVDEYALVQAITYGYGQTLPGGAFPYCYLFIDVKAELVDFNIHPTKKEVRLRNKADIHHQVVTMIRENLKQSYPVFSFDKPKKSSFDKPTKPFTFTNASEQKPLFVKNDQQKPKDDSWFEKARHILAQKESYTTDNAAKNQESLDFIYLGQVFNLFLVVEKDQSIFLIDQHAAHERILYDQIRSDGGIQVLMVPIQFEVERSVDDFLKVNSPWYSSYGLDLKQTGDLEWELSSIPALWKSIESEVVNFISSTSVTDLTELEKRLYSSIACHDSIRGGDLIDATTAEHLIKKVFELERPVCPHGRLFVVEITKENLLKSVGRTV